MAVPKARDRGRLRVPDRHEPPRPLRPHRPAAAAAAGRARAAGGERVSPTPTASGGWTSTTCPSSAGATPAGRAYGQTKLANLLFSSELQRQAVDHGTDAAGRRRPPRLRRHQPHERAGARAAFLAVPGRRRPARRAARPHGRAAPALRGDDARRHGRRLLGPDAFREQRGHPTASAAPAAGPRRGAAGSGSAARSSPASPTPGPDAGREPPIRPTPSLARRPAVRSAHARDAGDLRDVRSGAAGGRPTLGSAASSARSARRAPTAWRRSARTAAASWSPAQRPPLDLGPRRGR